MSPNLIRTLRYVYQGMTVVEVVLGMAVVEVALGMTVVEVALGTAGELREVLWGPVG